MPIAQILTTGQLFQLMARSTCGTTAPLKSALKVISMPMLVLSLLGFRMWNTQNRTPVGPIFTQYARLAPTMKGILDLSNYNNVTQSHNLNLLNRTLRLDIDHVSHMPTTRDLSPTKRAMILEWLDNPQYDEENTTALDQSHICKPIRTNSARPPDYFCVKRCGESLNFKDHPYVSEPYFGKIVSDKVLDDHFTDIILPGRPLSGDWSCSAENVTTQLQTAIQLEWATLPVYLTSLYSIVEDCNIEIYNVIRTVVMQEMLHFTQSANTLIAMGGSPLIDDAKIVPEFPTTGLPGNVLKKLYVNLEKFSLKHVFNVFMGIEIPDVSFVDMPVIVNRKYTIGKFYDEIKDCIKTLGDGVFYPDTVNMQVKWPWTPSQSQGNVVPVHDSKSAQGHKVTWCPCMIPSLHKVTR